MGFLESPGCLLLSTQQSIFPMPDNFLLLNLLINIMTNNFTLKNLFTEMISTIGTIELSQYLIISIIICVQLFILIRGLRNNSNDNSGSLILLGILGTFIGISFGLMVFNPLDIKESITEFLGGMKIAFLTSVTGMLGALILNNKVAKSIHNDAGIGDVIHAINNGNENLSNKLDIVNSSVGLLEKSITGDGDGSLLNQMILLRTNLNDKFADLTNEFREFAKLQAENNTKALVEAIREVIGDFNAKINEQFGENFKELNAAVGDLVLWQDNYKHVVDESYKQFEMAVESMDKSKEMLELIHNQYSDNLSINEDVKESLNVLKVEHDDLNDKMEAFKGLAVEAKSAFPIINENIDKLTSGFTEKVEESIETVTNAYKSQSDNASKIISEIHENTDSVLTTVKDSVQISNTAIKETTEAMQESVDASMSEISEKIVNGFNNSMANIEQLQHKFGENIEGTILQIDDALRQELEKSLQSLGSQLASLSKRFVDDYADLTVRMQQVVTMAES